MNPICREPSLYAPILTPFEVSVFVGAHRCYALTILPICFCRGRAEFIPTRSGTRLRVVAGLQTRSSLGRVLARTKAPPHNAKTSNPLVQGPGLCSWVVMRVM